MMYAVVKVPEINDGQHYTDTDSQEGGSVA